jgi:adenylyltransferase/sulfurtransferase
MKEISVEELRSWRETGKDHQLIDIREAWEIEVAQMGGTHIPMGELMVRMGELRTDVPVVIHCKSGGRSANMVQALEMHKGTANLYNLQGGINAWADRIDRTIEKY